MDVSLWGLTTAASTSARIRRLIESLNFLLPRGFANRQDLIGGDGLQSLDIPTGPGNFHELHRFVLAQAKVHALIACRQVTAGCTDQGVLLQSGFRYDVKLGADAVPIAGRADRVYEQPVITVCALVAEQECGQVVRVHNYIDETVVIQISEGHSAGRPGNSKSLAAPRGYILEFALDISHEQEGLHVTDGRLGQLDGVH